MSRGLTEDPTPEESEYGISDVVNINYAMIVHLQALEAKMNAIMDHLGVETPEEEL